MAEGENKEQEPVELILKDEVFKNNLEQDEQSRNLELVLQGITLAHLKNLTEFWENIKWNNYLYGSKEMDYFQLPVVNACLSEWRDEDCCDEAKIFEKCRICLKIIDKLNFALAVCVYATEKRRSFWRESIKNLQETIAEKLNELSFMLLKDGEKYINPKTENMEYGTKDNDGNYSITLCLWGNLYAAVRKQGMSVLGFSFKLPMDIVQENCAVRIMHTLFNHISPQKSIPQSEIKEDTEGLDASLSGECEVSEDANEVMKPMEKTSEITEDGKENETCVEEQDDLGDEAQIISVTETEKLSSTKEENERSHVSEEETLIQMQQQLSEVNSVAFDPSILPPLKEPDTQFVDPDEYFVVGGVFHFDLFVIPHLNIRKENFTYIHREKPKLRRIRYKRKIVPPRTLDRNMPYIITIYEKRRFYHELENTIVVQLQLPKKVIYLSTPEPARLFPEKDGYSRDCIYCTDYKEDVRQISFKTNQFGIFGMLQRKYQNLPYKKWALKGGSDAVLFSLNGSKLEIDIRVNKHGYTVTFLHPDDNLLLSEINSTWMTCDLLIEKLLAVGINIALSENSEKFSSISKKEKSLEDNVYDCMALLCSYINFISVSKCSSTEDEIVLEYITKNEGEIRRVMIRNNEVIDYEEEVKRIEKAKAVLKQIEDREREESEMEDLKLVEITEENPKIQNDVTEDAYKENDVFQEAEEKPIFHNLFHYVLHGMDEAEKEVLMNTNASLIENVRILLKLCRPISSM